jgi:hypothetical protein
MLLEFVLILQEKPVPHLIVEDGHVTLLMDSSSQLEIYHLVLEFVQMQIVHLNQISVS